ncbi:hypothetical protein K470DRAFT_192516, partial [Piedraia hortae CBS 480.64]
DEQVEKSSVARPQRDSWMHEPSALDVEHVASRRPQEPSGPFVSAKHAHELAVPAEPQPEPPKPKVEVDYEFGDAGSSWRMTKLKAVYRTAEEAGQSVDEVALQRYGDLQHFDAAREEERELERRRRYGKGYTGATKPTGYLFRERSVSTDMNPASPVQDRAEMAAPPAASSMPQDINALNKLKAQLMKARLRKDPDLARLEEEYKRATQSIQPEVVLGVMDSCRMNRAGEVIAVSGKRGRERGLVVENEDMSVEDMLRQEKRTKGLDGEDKNFARRIAKDGKFENNLDYMDENAEALSKRVLPSNVNLRNTTVAEYQKAQRIIDSCPLCHHEDREPASARLPAATVVSLATRSYLTLPPEPEVSRGGAAIVPIEHRSSLLDCDDDEWEEMRNFMKSLTRHYEAQDMSVIFYENAAQVRRGHHAVLMAVPLPHHIADSAPAYFREAVVSAVDEFSAQHKSFIDTLALSARPGYGRMAFRKTMVSSMPYFHVWFTIDGGLGHVIDEDGRPWPRGDLFAREVIGGVLGKETDVIRKQGRWGGVSHSRIEEFRRRWKRWDWTEL